MGESVLVTGGSGLTEGRRPALPGHRRVQWMRDMARVLRDGLGAEGRQVSTRQVPDVIVRVAARFRDPSLREITPALGRRSRHTTENARRVLGWQPRPARDTILDCARSLLAHGAA